MKKSALEININLTSQNFMVATCLKLHQNSGTNHKETLSTQFFMVKRYRLHIYRHGNETPRHLFEKLFLVTSVGGAMPVRIVLCEEIPYCLIKGFGPPFRQFTTKKSS